MLRKTCRSNCDADDRISGKRHLTVNNNVQGASRDRRSARKYRVRDFLLYGETSTAALGPGSTNPVTSRNTPE